MGTEGVAGIGGKAEEKKDDGGLGEGDEEALDDVFAFEVADFVGEDPDEFGGCLAFDEGIEKGDFFPFPEAGEEGVGLCGSF